MFQETVFQEKLMTSVELAGMMGVHRSTPKKWRREGRGPRYLKLGKSVRYALTDVQAWLNAHIVTSTTTERIDAAPTSPTSGWKALFQWFWPAGESA
jgi:excisionase family DNA binding protein